MIPPESVNHLGPIGHQHQNLGVQGLELFILMTQLRHMIDTVDSSKSNIENQHHILPAIQP
jgi:hypothetical protein